jgi:hypothetical protein
MKKRTIVSFLSLSIVAFAACKKDNDKSTAERLQGKWILQKQVWNNYNNADHKDSSTYTTGDNYMIFTSNSQVIYHDPYSIDDTVTFKMLNDQSLLIDQDTFMITKLTDTQLQWYSKETYSSTRWYEEWDSFTK